MSKNGPFTLPFPSLMKLYSHSYLLFYFYFILLIFFTSALSLTPSTHAHTTHIPTHPKHANTYCHTLIIAPSKSVAVTDVVPPIRCSLLPYPNTLVFNLTKKHVFAFYTTPIFGNIFVFYCNLDSLLLCFGFFGRL
jgi:hypothetical protein